jgi:hypothetical protein
LIINDNRNVLLIIRWSLVRVQPAPRAKLQVKPQMVIGVRSSMPNHVVQKLPVRARFTVRFTLRVFLSAGVIESRRHCSRRLCSRESSWSGKAGC